MIKSAGIAFHASELDINAAVTKFGGQPVWIDGPQWPLSKELGTPMRFICQIALDENIFLGCGGKMAYVFMTENEEYVDGTWEPDGGENAVIIQPNGKVSVPVQDISNGPTLQNYISVAGHDRLQPQNVILGVQCIAGEDPDFIPQEQSSEMSEEQLQEYNDKLGGNKVGGTPNFLQNDEFPDEIQSWRLLLQLDSCGVPFSINFGDSGIAYAFINEDASVGKFLWQCC
ncbi:MAG: DUF1963 domain-containing protein [Proteobacteria bacterium]|nr:DUF1963 domain-containing protein [Pseudomonadota bacterium]